MGLWEKLLGFTVSWLLIAGVVAAVLAVLIHGGVLPPVPRDQLVATLVLVALIPVAAGIGALAGAMGPDD